MVDAGLTVADLKTFIKQQYGEESKFVARHNDNEDMG